MNNVEKIKELVRDIERECDSMTGGMSLEQARKILVIVECIAATIRAYLFRFLAGGGQG